MFGEKPIVGQTIIRIKNDRIILPKFTHVEAGEEVSATIDPFQRKIILLQEKELLERLETLHKKMNLAKEEKRLSYSEYQDLQRYIWGILPLHERRITQKLEYQLFNRKPVASCELRQIQKLNLRDEVFAVGVGTTLELYPSEQSYYEYQEFEQERLAKMPK